MTNRIIRFAGLTGEQQRSFAKRRTEWDKENPSPEALEDFRQARRIFDMAERKSFGRRSFDASKLERPTLAYTDPAVVSQCAQRELEVLLGLLSADQRKKAAEQLQVQRARRRGEGDGGPEPLAAE